MNNHIKHDVARKYDNMLIASFLSTFPSFTINDINRTQANSPSDEGGRKKRPRTRRLGA